MPIVGQAADGDWTFHLSGGRLCLDFANTMSWRRSLHPIERLRSYRDLVSWGRQVGLVQETDAARLRRDAIRRPTEAAVFLRTALRLREVMFRTFARISDGQTPSADDLASLNRWIGRSLSHAILVPLLDGFAWTWTPAGHPFSAVLWSVVRSAADLMTSPDLHRIRQCAGSSCRWLFMDTTRNQSRRWCDMAVCGNRAKSARHYHLNRRSVGPTPPSRRSAPSN
jgi:predicted RNA-binding Zn ribbon-like protein